ncbi:MAG: DUF1553 domain-containing protein [Pedosphaera sp.]|nr:DUF1553 domain-containing protein [Pedosphaera sp.]
MTVLRIGLLLAWFLVGWLRVSAADSIRVEIVEGVPDEAKWGDTAPAPSESYTEPAFGFVALPTRYNEHGVKVDRGKPFLFRATATVALSAGEHRLLLRAHTGARLFIDGHEVLNTRFPDFKADGHEEVPEIPKALAPGLRTLRPGHFESLTHFVADGQPHVFKLEALIALKDRRPELGELMVATACACDSPEEFHLLTPTPQLRVPLGEVSFDEFTAGQKRFWRGHDVSARRRIAAPEEAYWQKRHDLARHQLETTNSKPETASIDAFISAKLKQVSVMPGPLTDDFAFLRRVSLDAIGMIPPPELVEDFARDVQPDKRARVIDRLLAQPGWADHWVSYWQDVLAENPGIVKPMLNNTGPFRWWLHEAFSDNLPMDRFATELISMEGSAYYGGPAGFALASENDVPMAQKAQIIAQAFLGMQMQCARCHDAPHHDFKQRDLFSLAAMLKRAPQELPWSSSIPTNAHITLGRKVKVTLAPGSKVEPAWPFGTLLAESELPEGLLRRPGDSREKLAALVTDARNPRFARVLVNRVWKRYLGWGLVEPVDDWEETTPSHPELLDYLARQLITHDYDLKHVSRLILNSEAYQREVCRGGSEEKPFNERLFASPARRRLSAEQLVDSLFFAAGKLFNAEELNMDVDSRRPVKEFNNLGTPQRAWEFASLSNERDRPALSIPRAQGIVDTLATFGWRESRQSPLTVRDEAPNVVQPATLANGVLAHGRVARLSDDSEITRLALREQPLPEFVRALYLRVFSRPPTRVETDLFVAHLSEGYSERRSTEFEKVSTRVNEPLRAVSWANHLHPEATRIKQEQERTARLGDPPTMRLKPAWRERAEDGLWAMVNSPEFVFVP